MKTLENFKQYFENTIKPVLEPLELNRIKVKNKTIFALIIMISIAALILLFGFNLFANSSGDVFSLVIALYLGACGWILYSIKKSYVSDFKDKIIQNIVSYIDPILVYQKSNYVGESYFNDCDLFSTHNRYSGDDYVSGMIVDQKCLEKTGVTKGTEIEFSEIEARHVTGSGKHRRDVTIFSGLMFVADFNKNFSGYTKIIPDGNKNWLFGGNDRISLEDPEFERLFEVYGSDQIESRYIVTPSLMERLKAFKQKTGRQVFASFRNNKIYICIWYSRNLFEPYVFKSLYDFAPMQQYFEDLQFAIGIVSDLNLNVRIWSKE